MRPGAHRKLLRGNRRGRSRYVYGKLEDSLRGLWRRAVWSRTCVSVVVVFSCTPSCRHSCMCLRGCGAEIFDLAGLKNISWHNNKRVLSTLRSLSLSCVGLARVLSVVTIVGSGDVVKAKAVRGGTQTQTFRHT